MSNTTYDGIVRKKKTNHGPAVMAIIVLIILIFTVYAVGKNLGWWDNLFSHEQVYRYYEITDNKNFRINRIESSMNGHSASYEAESLWNKRFRKYAGGTQERVIETATMYDQNDKRLYTVEFLAGNNLIAVTENGKRTVYQII